MIPGIVAGQGIAAATAGGLAWDPTSNVGASLTLTDDARKAYNGVDGFDAAIRSAQVFTMGQKVYLELIALNPSATYPLSSGIGFLPAGSTLETQWDNQADQFVWTPVSGSYREGNANNITGADQWLYDANPWLLRLALEVGVGVYVESGSDDPLGNTFAAYTHDNLKLAAWLGGGPFLHFNDDISFEIVPPVDHAYSPPNGYTAR